MSGDALTIAGRAYPSRLFMGSGGYPNQQVLLDSLAAAEPALVTVSIGGSRSKPMPEAWST